MNGAMAASLAGLAASTVWADASASNIANASDQSAVPTAPPPTPGQSPSLAAAYQPVAVSFMNTQGGGVTARVTPATPAYNAAYDPSSPSANSAGVVGLANVDLATELVNLAEANFAYRANIAAFNAADAMQKATLNLVA